MPIRVASIDPGKKNFATYVEEFDITKLDKIKTKYDLLPKKEQRRVKGPVSKDMQKILDAVVKCGTRVQIGVYNLKGCEEDTLDEQTRRNILAHLDSFKELWDTIDIFIIEQQFFNIYGGRKGKGGTSGGANMDALKIAEMCMCWFMIHYPFKQVISFGSQFKTQMIGCGDKMTKPQRKKWAIEKGREIAEMRKDEELISFLEKKRGAVKKDDVCDAMIQLQAFKFKNFILE
jgi:hypothetical protein